MYAKQEVSKMVRNGHKLSRDDLYRKRAACMREYAGLLPCQREAAIEEADRINNRVRAPTMDPNVRYSIDVGNSMLGLSVA